MIMIKRLDRSQKEALSNFFNNIAVAWFIAIFVSPSLASGFSWLTFIAYSFNMIGALYISMALLKEEKK